MGSADADDGSLVTKVDQARRGSGAGDLFCLLSIIDIGFERHVLDQDVMADPTGQLIEKMIGQSRLSAPGITDAQCLHEPREIPVLILVHFSLRKSECFDDPLFARKVEPCVGCQRVQNRLDHGAGLLTVLDPTQQTDDPDKATVIRI